MKSLKRSIRVVLLAILGLGAWFGYYVHIQLKRAKMASQCAVLSAEIQHAEATARDGGKTFSLDEFLAHYSGQGLFRRNQSGCLLDSWGRPLVIEQLERDGRAFTKVTSLGRDGKLGTRDDHSREFASERRKPDES